VSASLSGLAAVLLLLACLEARQAEANQCLEARQDRQAEANQRCFCLLLEARQLEANQRRTSVTMVAMTAKPQAMKAIKTKQAQQKAKQAQQKAKQAQQKAKQAKAKEAKEVEAMPWTKTTIKYWSTGWVGLYYHWKLSRIENCGGYVWETWVATLREDIKAKQAKQKQAKQAKQKAKHKAKQTKQAMKAIKAKRVKAK
jgi:opacity protein-like surface antigen